MPHDLFGTRVIAAPMAGGTSTPAFVAGRARAPAAWASWPPATRAWRPCRRKSAPSGTSGARFGMNVFVPDPAQLPPSAAVLARAGGLPARSCAPTPGGTAWNFRRLRLDDDDDWQGKIDALLADPVELVSFTFGLPGPGRGAGAAAGGVGGAGHCDQPRPRPCRPAEQGVDALVVQHASAGGHSARLPVPGRRAAGWHRPARHDGGAARRRCGPPSTFRCVAAGGDHGCRPGWTPCWRPGPQAAQLGTAFLRTDESGARQLHKDALASPHFTQTRLTRAFTGRQARALENEFVRDHPDAPEAYPAVHHLTAPLGPRLLRPGTRSG